MVQPSGAEHKGDDPVVLMAFWMAAVSSVAHVTRTWFPELPAGAQEASASVAVLPVCVMIVEINTELGWMTPPPPVDSVPPDQPNMNFCGLDTMVTLYQPLYALGAAPER
jgi:hypothetical protein